MANKIEKIAEKKKKGTLAKQETEVSEFAKRVADEVVGKIDDVSLKESIAELAKTVAHSITISNHTLDLSLQDSFTRLLEAVNENKPDQSGELELSLKIGEQLSKLEDTFKTLELSPNITVEGLSLADVREEIGKIVSRLPEDQKRVVTIAYEKVFADQYLNVRLTDGISFYKATGGVGGGGGTSNGLTDTQLRASPVEVTGELAIETTGLATDANQTTIIGHVDGIETLIGATNTALGTIDGRVDTLETLIASTNTKLDSVIAAQKTDWGLNDQEETGTYKYFGFESPSGSWKITRKTLADGSFRYATGASNYSTAWTGRAGQTYDTYGVTF